MGELKTYQKWIILVHVLFWSILTSIMYFIFWRIFNVHAYAITATTFNLLGFVILVYVHLLFLLSRLFDKKLYLKYFIGVCVLILATAVLRFFGGLAFVNWMGWVIKEEFNPSYFGNMIFGGFFLLLITIPLRLVENWFKQQELQQELKTHQLEAELRFLKAQVNPHFLFNALNNIYSLSFTESKKAPEMILKLSDMMSYMLYDCKSEKVRLEDEIAYLQNYIDLQQLKKDGEFNISFEPSGDIQQVMITPMLFIPFFENAIKHGNLENTVEGWLKSWLNVDHHQLQFHISNSFCPKQSNTNMPGGVGLENIRERLLLLYPEKHQLTIKEGEGEFSVHLSLTLSP